MNHAVNANSIDATSCVRCDHFFLRAYCGEHLIYTEFSIGLVFITCMAYQASLGFDRNQQLYGDRQMSLIKPNPNQDKVNFKVKIGSNSLDEIAAYCAWAGFNDHGEFIEKVVDFMLEKDIDWKKYRKESF